MPYSVRLPDGRVIQGIPDDVSQADAKKRILEFFPDIAAKEKRGWGEAISDIGASLTSSIGRLAQFPGEVAELTGITKPEDREKGLQGIGRRVEEFGEEAKSPILKGKETMRAKKIGEAEGLASEFTTAIKETIRDPALFTSFFAEQVPNLLGSWGGGLIARGTVKAILRETTEEAAKKVGMAGVAGAVGTGAVMQGADIGSETYETIYKQLRKDGVPDEEANGIALSKARVAALEAFGLSIGTSRLPGGSTIERALAGKGLPGAGGFTKGALREAVSEGIEEGGGAFARQVGIQEVFPETSLTKGVGAAAGMGALGGALFGGPAGAIEGSREFKRQEAIAKVEELRASREQAELLAVQAEDQARRDAYEAEQKEIQLRAIQEGATVRFTQSQAYQDLLEEVEQAKAKRDAAFEKADRAKAQASAFATAEQDLAGTFFTPQKFEPVKEEFVEGPVAPPPARPEGQMDLALPEATGQLTLPEVGIQQPAPAVPEVTARPVTEKDFETMNINKSNKKLRAELLGKDLNDPAQLQEVRTRLEDWVQQGRSEPINKGVAAFLDSIPKPLQEQEQGKLKLRRPYGSLKQRAAETESEAEDVGRTIEPIAGVDESGVQVPSGGVDATAGTTGLERRGVAPAIGTAEQPVVGEGRVEPTLETAAVEPPAALDTPEGYQAEIDFQLQALDGVTDPAERRSITQKVRELETKRDEAAKIPKVERSSVFGATTEELAAAIQQGDLRKALQIIANDKTGQFNILEALVAKRLLANNGSLPKIQVVPFDQIGASGEYNPFTDTIRIAEGDVDSHTVLHETVHGFLHSLIQKFESDGIANKGIADLNNIYKFVQERHPELVTQYGMTNLSEFVSEAMSNREFQAALAQIPYRLENQSLFTAFVRAVLNALGLSPTQKLSALAATMFAADRTLATGRKVQEDVVTGQETIPVANVQRTKYDDIEAAAGYTGKRPDPTKPFQTRTVSKEEFKGNVNKFLNKLETMWFSSDAALNNAIRNELEKNKTDWNLVKEAMLKISTSQATHADAVAMQFLQVGNLKYDPATYKWRAEEDTNNWQSIIKDVSNIAKKYGVSEQKMNDYAHQAFIAERLKGLAKSKKDFFSHKSPEQIEAGLRWFQEFPELRAVQAKWNAVRKNAMDIAIEGGLYNKDQAEELLDAMDYVPFLRVEQLEAGAGPKEYGRGLLDFAKNYKIRGSQDEVNNVFDNMERWISYTVSRAVKNKTALNMYDLAKELMPEEVKELRQDERVHRDQNVIDIWKDGIRQKVEFKDPLFIYAFQGMENIAIPSMKSAAAVANILRKNIVLVPLFSISQLSQDSFAAMLSSGLKHPFRLPLEVVKEFVNTLRGTSTAAKELAKYGAVGVKDYSAAVARNEAEIAAGLRSPSKVDRILSPLEKIAMASDNAVRQAVYNMTLREGGDKATAVERAFEIINFKRSGASGAANILRQVIPFFGAYLQAQNVVYKTVMGKSIAPAQKKEAQRILQSNATKIAALAFLYTALVSDDDDYQKMDPTIRDRHLVIPGTGFMLPLRTDIFLLPKLAAEYAYQAITDAGYTDGTKMRRGMKDALVNAIGSPTVVPQIVKPFVEVGVNYNFFTGRPIIGRGLENLPTSQQYSNYTSELAKIIGSTGIIAPVNVDHLIKGLFGTTGGIGLAMTSSMIDMGNNIPAPEKTWQDAVATTPGFSAFFYREYGNADKNDFYELKTEVDKAVNGFNRMKKRGQVEEAKEFLEEKKDLIKVRSQVNNINNQLSKIRERENYIYELSESKMSAEQKGEEIRKLREIEKKLLNNVMKLRQTAGF